MSHLPGEKWKTIAEIKEEYFWKEFQYCGGHISSTSRLIKLSRASIYRYLDKYKKKEKKDVVF